METPENREHLWLGGGEAKAEADSTPGQPPNRPAAGWYQNPDGPGHRYWDGGQWTEHFSGVVPPPSTPHGAQAGVRPGAYWGAVAGCGAMAIGAFGPWVSALGGSVT